MKQYTMRLLFFCCCLNCFHSILHMRSKRNEIRTGISVTLYKKRSNKNKRDEKKKHKILLQFYKMYQCLVLYIKPLLHSTHWNWILRIQWILSILRIHKTLMIGSPIWTTLCIHAFDNNSATAFFIYQP